MVGNFNNGLFSDYIRLLKVTVTWAPLRLPGTWYIDGRAHYALGTRHERESFAFAAGPCSGFCLAAILLPLQINARATASAATDSLLFVF